MSRPMEAARRKSPNWEEAEEEAIWMNMKLILCQNFL
jgi:hypothetical protein